MFAAINPSHVAGGRALALGDEHRTSLMHQLVVVKRRVRATMQELSETIESLPTPEQLHTIDDHARECDFYNHCIRLEVALDEARTSAKKLADQAHLIASGPGKELSCSSLRAAGNLQALLDQARQLQGLAKAC